MKPYPKVVLILISLIMTVGLWSVTGSTVNAKRTTSGHHQSRVTRVRRKRTRSLRTAKDHRRDQSRRRRMLARIKRIRARNRRIQVRNRHRRRMKRNHRRRPKHARHYRRKRLRPHIVVRTIANGHVIDLGQLPYGRGAKPILSSAQSILINPDGRTALIGYLGINLKNDELAEVALRHHHPSIVWNSGTRAKRFRLWNRKYRRKLGHMQSVTVDGRNVAIFNDRLGVVKKGRIFLFNPRDLKPVRVYRVSVKRSRLGDSLAYDEHDHDFYDAYNNHNVIVVDRGTVHRGNKIVFKRLPFRSPCYGRARNSIVQGLAYDPKNDRLYIETGRRDADNNFYGIRSVPVRRLNQAYPQGVRFYFLHRNYSKEGREPEGISFDRHGNMYMLLRRPETVYRINANQLG